MSKIIVPKNREELLFAFKQAAIKSAVESPDKDTLDLLAELLPELVSEVPASAFEPVQPVDEGILFYHGTVEEGEVVDFQHDLMRAHLNLPKGKPITLNLSSVGGSVYAGLALISTVYDIQRAGRKVNIHIQGVAMSMGSVIAQVANYRTIEPSAFFMLHEVSYAMRGSTAEHEEEQLFSKALQDALYIHYSARTGKPLKYYQDMLKRRNWYMTAPTALEEGLVDAIVPAPIYAVTAVAQKTPVRGRKKAA